MPKDRELCIGGGETVKIAILHDWTLSKENVDRVKALGPVTVYDGTDSEDQVIERLKGIDIAVIDQFHLPITRKIIEGAEHLKLLVMPSTAYDGVDLDAASEQGIKVANVPGFSTESVAEHAIALMFSVIRRIPLGNQKIREKPLQASVIESDLPLRGFEVTGRTLGILGLGNIGGRIAELGLGLGMNVVAYNRTPRQMQGVEMVSFDDVLRTSDVVSLSLALTPETENIIGARELTLMKPSAVLISTAIGSLVNTQALFKALEEKRIFGAGLDLLAEWDEDNPLLGLENIVLTPHTAWWTEEATRNFADIIVANIETFMRGEPTNLLN